MIAGAISTALAVIFGAFGAHVIKNTISSQMLEVYQTAVTYHFYHALGLFAVALAASFRPGSMLVNLAGWGMLAGIILFSGSLYGLSLSGVGWLGVITPLGGVLFIVSWLMLAAAFFRR